LVLLLREWSGLTLPPAVLASDGAGPAEMCGPEIRNKILYLLHSVLSEIQVFCAARRHFNRLGS
jgi:hypothetical protein